MVGLVPPQIDTVKHLQEETKSSVDYGTDTATGAQKGHKSHEGQRTPKTPHWESAGLFIFCLKSSPFCTQPVCKVGLGFFKVILQFTDTFPAKIKHTMAMRRN